MSVDQVFVQEPIEHTNLSIKKKCDSDLKILICPNRV